MAAEMCSLFALTMNPVDTPRTLSGFPEPSICGMLK